VGRGEFLVTLAGAGTEHRVTVPAGLLERLGLGDEDSERLIRESFAFLLEREPATSILGRFALEDIARYFPEYPDQIEGRMS